MKLKSALSTFILMLALALPGVAATATGVAQLKGTYAFSVSGINNSGTANDISEKITVGTISFNGAGTAEFLTLVNYNQQIGGGGPVVKTPYKYTVSGFTGSLTIPGNKGGVLSFTLGVPNASGVAQVIVMLIPESNPKTGIAVLQ